MENLDEFKKRIRKVNMPREHKIRNSLGVYDGYKYYRKNKPKEKKYTLKESQYFAIIRHINNLLSEEIIKGNDVRLPMRMGMIEIRKYDKNVKVDENNKVHTNLPIDWDSTLKLWYEDEEAYHNRTLIKLDELEMFKICYNRSSANYNNKMYYELVFNKDMKIRLKHKIKEGKIDALYIGRKNQW